MTISRDLFLAILSMDSYNRGYASGIADGGVEDTDGLGDSNGTKVGTATIIGQSSSDIERPECAAGFYALAYTLDTGETVISYRGTDGLTLGTSPITGGSDIFNGWFQGAGTPTNQSRLALDFYSDVTNGGLPTASVGWVKPTSSFLSEMPKSRNPRGFHPPTLLRDPPAIAGCVILRQPFPRPRSCGIPQAPSGNRSEL